jgi:hypothetical protein
MRTIAINRRPLSMSSTLESRVRRKARRLGYWITKSRERKYVPHSNNAGEFMLLGDYSSTVVLGDRYDATLDQIESFLDGVRA